MGTYLELTDTPGSYSGKGAQVVAVKGAEDGLEFIEAGAQGPQGPQGYIGEQGVIGEGVQGAQGPEGSQGEQGQQGWMGVQGPPGGAQGDQGPQGPNEFVDLIDTPASYSGQQGKVVAVKGAQDGVEFVSTVPDSDKWKGHQLPTLVTNKYLYTADGINLSWETGGQGPQGYQGYQGNTGAQGPTGDQGSEGDQGDQGFQGSTGAQGAEGDQGYQGFQGVKGDQGYQGYQGVPGPTGYVVNVADDRALGDVTPDGFADKQVRFTFTDDIAGSPNPWDSLITMKGWSDGYRVWQLFSNSNIDDVDLNLYFRTGRGATWGSIRKIWDSGNDGSGSGLDADKLEGYHASVSAGNNTIVQRHASGYIYANYFNTTPNDVASGVTKVCVESGNDGFIRHGTVAGIRLFIGAGTGGGLDADKLEGYHGASASTVNTYARRDASGDISARLFRSEYDTTNASCNYIMTQIDTVSNNYIRPSTKAQLIASLNLMTKAGGTFTSHVYAADHPAAATDAVINVCYGTGSPPSASGTTIGTLFVKYV